MKTWTKIAVAYDGSEEAHVALVEAADLADVSRGSLVLICIAPVEIVAATPGGIAQAEQASRACEEFHEQASAYLDSRGLSAELIEDVGQPAKAIVAVAEEEGADLIVTGTSDPGFLDRLFGGSVSESVAREANCDVLVVRRSASDVD